MCDIWFKYHSNINVMNTVYVYVYVYYIIYMYVCFFQYHWILFNIIEYYWTSLRLHSILILIHTLNFSAHTLFHRWNDGDWTGGNHPSWPQVSAIFSFVNYYNSCIYIYPYYLYIYIHIIYISILYIYISIYYIYIHIIYISILYMYIYIYTIQLKSSEEPVKVALVDLRCFGAPEITPCPEKVW